MSNKQQGSKSDADDLNSQTTNSVTRTVVKSDAHSLPPPMPNNLEIPEVSPNLLVHPHRDLHAKVPSTSIKSETSSIPKSGSLDQQSNSMLKYFSSKIGLLKDGASSDMKKDIDRQMNEIKSSSDSGKIIKQIAVTPLRTERPPEFSETDQLGTKEVSQIPTKVESQINGNPMARQVQDTTISSSGNSLITPVNDLSSEVSKQKAKGNKKNRQRAKGLLPTPPPSEIQGKQLDDQIHQAKNQPQRNEIDNIPSETESIVKGVGEFDMNESPQEGNLKTTSQNLENSESLADPSNQSTLTKDPNENQNQEIRKDSSKSSRSSKKKRKGKSKPQLDSSKKPNGSDDPNFDEAIEKYGASKNEVSTIPDIRRQKLRNSFIRAMELERKEKFIEIKVASNFWEENHTETQEQVAKLYDELDSALDYALKLVHPAEAYRRFMALRNQVDATLQVARWIEAKATITTVSDPVDQLLDLLRIKQTLPDFFDADPDDWKTAKKLFQEMAKEHQEELTHWIGKSDAYKRFGLMYAEIEAIKLGLRDSVEKAEPWALMQQGVRADLLLQLLVHLELYSSDVHWEHLTEDDLIAKGCRVLSLFDQRIPIEEMEIELKEPTWENSPVKMWIEDNSPYGENFWARLGHLSSRLQNVILGDMDRPEKVKEQVTQKYVNGIFLEHRGLTMAEALVGFQFGLRPRALREMKRDLKYESELVLRSANRKPQKPQKKKSGNFENSKNPDPPPPPPLLTKVKWPKNAKAHMIKDWQRWVNFFEIFGLELIFSA
ncbi:hypothetical protein CROQUDRAFT_697518 [Cronartium quercuum f. sp. fusiforme G11]|uniref:Uncharacterized protein n=1 Tax=Cronartium quercuum f. sp. fusiforme G11 TaxID=708437 RepID=A0A9P6TDH0_9BASI|nr:hypothetical protein CROQUDRAFT_697518 [Cronartium quercuum f. sp. fusiforme G11]